MDWLRETPESLNRAQLPLDSIEDLTVLQTFAWNRQAQKWTMRFRISMPELDANCSLAASEWYLAVDESYPVGRIGIYPAKDKGITDTHPHQSYNHEGEPELPWRAGNICVNTPAKIIGRHGYDVEPYNAEDRLLWHCQRAVEWVRSASRGELILAGEPFELPHIPPFPEVESSVRFCEGAIDTSPWSNGHAAHGRAGFFNLSTNEKTWFLDVLRGPKNEEVLRVHWGSHVTRLKGKTWDGIWLRLPDMPSTKPYRFCETWGELRQVLSEQSVSLKGTLRATAQFLRDGEPHFLLLGFPIPALYGGVSVVMHWMVVALPPLSRGKQYPDGFRANEEGYVENDMRQVLRHNRQLVYLKTENWHSNQIQTRGRFHEDLRTSRVAVVGCGALGAPIAEMLVRGGVFHMTLFDGEKIEIGNLSRHTLSMRDLGYGKAARLALRLNSLNPHAEVVCVPARITTGNEEISRQLLESDIIIDCTANDDVLYALSAISFPRSVNFFTSSVGFRAKRMFFYQAKDTSFPVDEYFTEISPWIEAERNEFKGETYPREGIGCYHPVFPARCDDMWLWASIAAKIISAAIDDPKSTEPSLRVYEQKEDGSVSIGEETRVPACG